LTSGGTAIVSAGGIASAFSVSSGGALVVASGGLAVVEPGGFVSGTATVGSGGVFELIGVDGQNVPWLLE
jgi:autotransporter passenger strand-loop-strand repeat protein